MPCHDKLANNPGRAGYQGQKSAGLFLCPWRFEILSRLMPENASDGQQKPVERTCYPLICAARFERLNYIGTALKLDTGILANNIGNQSSGVKPYSLFVEMEAVTRNAKLWLLSCLEDAL
jgi:hypothetical protein